MSEKIRFPLLSEKVLYGFISFKKSIYYFIYKAVYFFNHPSLSSIVLHQKSMKGWWKGEGGGRVGYLYPPVASQLIFNRKRRKKQTSLLIVVTPKNLPTTHGDLYKCSDRSMEYILLLKRISLSLCKQRYLGGMYSHKPLSKKFFL